MATKYAQHVSTKVTPQGEPIPGRPMVANSAGGYSFAVDCWTRLDRFLVLGNEGGSYCASEKQLTQENAKSILECAGVDTKRAVARIVEISESGRAPKNDPAIFALSLLVGHLLGTDRQLALEAMPRVCRTGTHLFQFAESVQAFRGWGRGLRRSIGSWYTSKEPRDLAYQLTKYQQRNGWSHRDLLRLSHVKTDNPTMNVALKWAVGKADLLAADAMPDASLVPILAFEQAKRATSAKEIARVIRDHGLVRECVPTQFLADASVWEALLEKMPMMAMIRNLATMTRVGLIAPMSNASRTICERLRDGEYIRKSKLHPLSILIAMKIYAQGRGDKSANTWTPVQDVVDALDSAFYLGFDSVEPTKKRWFFGVDVSGSMGATCAGSPLTCCEGATALALVSNAVEQNTFVGRFNNGIEAVPFGRKTRMDDALRYTRSINCGGTDCSLPMIYALEKKMPVDAFVVLTDSETWAGRMHPAQAIQEYRQKMGIPAKLIVVGMVSNNFTIADPADGGMMDVVGFDTAVPQIMADFVR